jgi:hypothetical protein
MSPFAGSYWNRDRQRHVRRECTHQSRNLSRDNRGCSTPDRRRLQSPAGDKSQGRIERRPEASFAKEKVALQVLGVEAVQRTMRARICGNEDRS